MSLGIFVFVSAQAQGSERERMIAHECGHTVQSLMLGPLYLPVVGLTSVLWCNAPQAKRYRARTGTDYFAMFPENWANRLGGV